MAGARSQRHMNELPDVYPQNSGGGAKPVLVTDITSKATSTTVNVATATNFSGEESFGAENLPEGCTIHATTGVVSGTSSAGAYTNCRIFAENEHGVTYTSRFTWTVT